MWSVGLIYCYSTVFKGFAGPLEHKDICLCTQGSSYWAFNKYLLMDFCSQGRCAQLRPLWRSSSWHLPRPSRVGSTAPKSEQLPHGLFWACHLTSSCTPSIRVVVADARLAFRAGLPPRTFWPVNAALLWPPAPASFLSVPSSLGGLMPGRRRNAACCFSGAFYLGA